MNKVTTFHGSYELERGNSKTFMTKAKGVFLFSMLMLSSSLSAQTDQTSMLDSGSIDQKFGYILDRSTTYKGENAVYEVIKEQWITGLRQQVNDSLKNLRSIISQREKEVTQQRTQITELQDRLLEATQQVDQLSNEMDGIEILGLSLQKSLYQSIIWGLILILFLALVYFIYRFQNGNMVTNDSIKQLRELEAEFEEYRRSALEREQKVRRQLLDEINRNRKSSK